MKRVVPLVLVGVPLLVAVFGPLFVGEASRSVAFSTGGLLGTDFVGRDVLQQVLLGGRTVVLVALVATGLAYALGIPLALVAATSRRRWVDEVLMRPLDLVLAVPSLLVLVLVAGLSSPGSVTLVGVVVVVLVPEVARVVRAAALPAASGPVVEAMRMQGEGWWRTSGGYVGRSVLPTVVADLGVRFTSSVYLVASAAFLGVGVAPDASDWAVMVDRNQGGSYLVPWAVVVPALLIVSLSVGVNLLFDAHSTAVPRTLPDDPAVTPPAVTPIPATPPVDNPASSGGSRQTPAVGSIRGLQRTDDLAGSGLAARVRDLRVVVDGRPVVDGVSFELPAGKVLALVGESGSGKTTTALALLGEAPGDVHGEVATAGFVGFVPQHPSTVLNPVRRIGGVLREVVRARKPGTDPGPVVRDVLTRVGLDPTWGFRRRLPHQLSGGQQQRLVLAQTLIGDPAVVIADEPTTGQDALSRGEVAAQLKGLADRGVGVLLLSHDLDLVDELADDVLTLHAGVPTETRPPEPTPTPAPKPPPTGPTVLSVDGLSVGYRGNRVLDGVSLRLAGDECVAITGRSGQGKTTLARAIAGLHRPSAGTITVDGGVQYVFQDARLSFDDRRPVLDQVARTAVRLRGLSTPDARDEAAALLRTLGLDRATAARRPGALSGGELRRAALARALLARPRVLVCDEITAGLDARTRRVVLDHLADLDLALVVVTHDEAAVARLADRTLAVQEGGLHNR
ncbi:ABC transporter ATP-binding protein/permease [Actinokineospora spheciospongiae]|uniref:ABC transporter ATP-binding protein/permease n=1 Tax=Actinokineospora spheciospongiae TaxID=909613 RepID=UPI000D962DA8|nr:ATP-binding cassette domain-containing protein [Actinokineospora spheciospongiae]PWW57010.1 peptide/nickel transport system ATP-binding protein [Actinokineospora spheciospongiae]